ncbi:multidrug effflux MFS transporter [Lacticaseibacillus porcinae]|uniref:multidrug effflux MFS transporter n=1 Tax=Lacticaseibacillus porcinae TaxID=1123687 RepID=UPI000F7B8E36|nr:multidrug effflux MFS transporter [Lacticaseibacillus porcinae]
MKNVQKQVPSILILIALVGFPQISESIFTPVLPAISRTLSVTAQTSQLTMGSYFVGFAIGVLVWGRLSDGIGRRPAMLWGIAVYLFGNFALWLAPNFKVLMFARVLQAFGAASGSVITQTIMRESFSGVEGERVFAKISAAMALAPALGPLIGGALATYFGNYRFVFVGLMVMAGSLWFYVLWRLPETRITMPEVSPWPQVAVQMLRSPQVWGYGLLISGINGILFSYYAEAPFIFEQHFGMSTVQYGWLGLLIAGSSILGALITNYTAGKLAPNKLISYGLLIAVLGACGMWLAAENLIASLLMIFIMFGGIYTALPLVLNRALIGFEAVIGTASGLLSFGYYLLISALTLLMSAMHDGSVLALPKYVLLVGVLMLIADRLLVNHESRR